MRNKVRGVERTDTVEWQEDVWGITRQGSSMWEVCAERVPLCVLTSDMVEHSASHQRRFSRC